MKKEGTMTPIDRVKEHEVKVARAKRLSQVQGCFLGVAIGDAIGMPVETMTAAEIREKTGGRGVIGFMDSIQQNLRSIAGYTAGKTTDDWQLTRALAQCLMIDGAYVSSSVAQAYVREYDRCRAGWGGTTKKSVVELKEYFESGGVNGRSFFDVALPAEPGKGAGNGVAMKVTPLAIMAGLPNEEKAFYRFKRMAITDGLMTHPDPRATIAACVLGCVMMGQLRDPIVNVTDEIVRQHLTGARDVAIALEESLQSEFPEKYWNDDTISRRLTRIIDNQWWKDVDALVKGNGNSSFSPASVPFSIAMYYRNPHDFRTAILETVNAGGDTDTNASMVGALVGITNGLDCIPPDWRYFRSEFEEAVTLGEEFFKKFA
jgi:ADP-ribosylglycohydrolase